MQTPFGQLTYCTNIHSGESWQAHFAQLAEHLPQIKKKIAPHQPMGIGLRLSHQASLDLQAKGKINVFKDWLQQQNGYVFTLNGFPYGGFHGTVVKEQVHAPDWRTGERVAYTLRLAQVLAELLPPGVTGGISTSPLSYRHWFAGKAAVQAAVAKATENILVVVQHLVQLEKETGKCIHLDIEPEPDGLLETGAEFLDWYKKSLLPAGIAFLKPYLNGSQTAAEEKIKRHVALCYDVCHFAIGYESPEPYLEDLKREGIQVGKLQISAALKSVLPEEDHERQKVFEAFSLFNEPVYLHQVVAKDAGGNLLRYRDLPLALADEKARKAVEWRTHFHVPLFSDAFGPLHSTQKEIIHLLQRQSADPFTQHLEVETYTWEVLQPQLKKPLADSIIQELQWVQQQLAKGKTNL